MFSLFDGSTTKLEFLALNFTEPKILLNFIHGGIHGSIACPQDVIDVGAQDASNFIGRARPVVSCRFRWNLFEAAGQKNFMKALPKGSWCI